MDEEFKKGLLAIAEARGLPARAVGHFEGPEVNGDTAEASMGKGVAGGTGLEHQGVGAFADAYVLQVTMLPQPARNGVALNVGDDELRHGAVPRGSGREAVASVDEPAREGPAKGMGFARVPMPDEAQYVACERRQVFEAAVAQQAALQDAEPDLDLVDPRSVQGGVHEAEAVLVLLVEARPAMIATLAVQVEIVPDDVDSASR